MNLDILQENIGLPYSEKFGCSIPIYLLYPEIPHYKYVDDFKYFFPIVLKYFFEIKKEEIGSGDLLIFQTKKGNHFGIYDGKGKIFHCTERSKLQLSKFTVEPKYCLRRKNGKSF